jgi:hypothetical protein
MVSRATSALLPWRETALGRRASRDLTAAVLLARAVTAFDRPQWLLRRRNALPRVQGRVRAPHPVSDSDVALCSRLIDAFHLATNETPPPDGMWTHDVFQERQRNLAGALHAREPALLASRLASMFQAEFVIGLALGSLGLATHKRLSARFSELSVMNKFAALAEALGATRTENPEQGTVALAYESGLADLVERTESALGASLDFPDVGAAYGSEVAGRLITPDSPDQMYGAVRVLGAIREFARTREGGAVRVVEIGGGYGGMAYWLMQMTSNVDYTIVDLPIVNVLQGYFLSKAIGAEAVSFYGEPAGRVAVVPTHALPTVDAPIDILVNKDSMPEIPEAALREYLEWAKRNCTGVFYSYNQEAGASFDGDPQNVVREVVDEVGGFECARRDPSWLRRGYVEEVYLPSTS